MSKTVFLKNKVARLLTLSRFSGEKNDNGGSLFEKYKLLPAGPAVEVPVEMVKDCKVVEQWVKSGDVEVIDVDEDLLGEDDDEVDEEREQLITQAKELKIRFNKKISNENLQVKVDAALEKIEGDHDET